MKFVQCLVLAVGLLSFWQFPAQGAQSAMLTCVADTALFEQNTNHNLGGMNFLPIGRTSAGTRAHGLYKFTVAEALPAGAIIRSATLELEVVFHDLDMERSFSVHRLMTGWGEGDKSGGPESNGSLGAPATAGEATWFSRFHPNSAWAQPGGASGIDYASAPSASEDIAGVGRYIFTSDGLVRDVQAWLDNPGTNFGWLVKIDNEMATGTALRFASREDTEGAGPTLRVEYDPPGQTRPVLTNSRRNGAAFQFDFNADANRIYFAEYTTDFRVWTLLELVPPGSARTVTITDPIESGPRFYRITGL